MNQVKFLGLGKSYYRGMDLGWLELMGGQGGSLYLIKASSLVDKWGSIHLKIYLYFIVFTIFSAMALYYLSSLKSEHSIEATNVIL